MMYSAIARIESYKHYQAGAIHKEAVRELTGYKNPNWRAEKSGDNVYFERMELDKPFEEWVYDYRVRNGVVGRYYEHHKNPRNETNAMCQFFSTVPGYIDTLSRDEQIELLRKCYDFFRAEFPDVPVLEAVCHFDETSPHLQINFLPVVERMHKKRGKEKIFSTTLLMPGEDYFSHFQDRFYSYMEEILQTSLKREKGGAAKHVAPKEFREATAELVTVRAETAKIRDEHEALQIQVALEQEEVSRWRQVWQSIRDALLAKKMFSLQLRQAEKIRDLERQVKYYRLVADTYKTLYAPLDVELQRKIDRLCGTHYADKAGDLELRWR